MDACLPLMTPSEYKLFRRNRCVKIQQYEHAQYYYMKPDNYKDTAGCIPYDGDKNYKQKRRVANRKAVEYGI